MVVGSVLLSPSRGITVSGISDVVLVVDAASFVPKSVGSVMVVPVSEEKIGRGVDASAVSTRRML